MVHPKRIGVHRCGVNVYQKRVIADSRRVNDHPPSISLDRKRVDANWICSDDHRGVVPISQERTKAASSDTPLLNRQTHQLVARSRIANDAKENKGRGGLGFYSLVGWRAGDDFRFVLAP